MSTTSSSTENRKGLASFIASLPLIRRGKVVKELFLEKLDVLQEKFDDFGQKINLLLENDTPLLQATIAITKILQNIQTENLIIPKRVL
jgi:hypothetical protein